MLVFMYAVPVVALGLVAGAAVGRRLATGPRRAAIVAAILIGCGALALLRMDGADGSFTVDFEWRWSPTAEETPRPSRRRARADRECRTGVDGVQRAADLFHAGGGRSSGALCRPGSRVRDEPSPVPAADQLRRPQADCSSGARPTQLSRPRRREPMRSGRDFADRSATASFAVCGSRPTGRSRRPSSCGAARWDRAGRPSPSTAISSIPRSSSVKTRVVSCYKLTPANGVADTGTRPDSGRRARRRAARDADAPATAASTPSARPES